MRSTLGYLLRIISVATLTVCIQLVVPLAPICLLIVAVAGGLFVWLWRQKKTKDQLFLSVLFLVPAVVTVVFSGYMIISYQVACYEWDKSGFDNHPPTTKCQVERSMRFAILRQQLHFRDLFISGFFQFDEGKHIYSSCNSRFNDYFPKEGDQYIVYRVLGVMPIDVVYDYQGEVIMLYPAFTY